MSGNSLGLTQFSKVEDFFFNAMVTQNTKRMYGGVFIGFGIRGQIGLSQIFRMRRGNGHYGSNDGEIYQDKYTYFVPDSITNAESAAYRTLFADAVAYWQDNLDAAAKKAYNARASHGLHMSGYNLFIAEVVSGKISI